MDPAEFVRAHTTPARVPWVPEIALHLATDVTPLWHATEAWLDRCGVPPPFWAFAWAGGQALARYVMDGAPSSEGASGARSPVRGARVVDVGCGGGIVALAAARAGASRVLAIDRDPFAAAACTLNAAANGLPVDVRCGEALDLDALLAEAPDVITGGDLWYERDTADAFARVLRHAAARGVTVLSADPARAYVPTRGVRELARYDVPTPDGLEGATHKTTRVFTFDRGAS